MESLRERVDAFYKTLSPSTDLLAAAQSSPNLIGQRTGPFTSVSPPAGIGRDLKFIGTALALKPGDLSKPVEGNRGFYIIKLSSETDFDLAKYNTERATVHDQILQEKRNQFLSEWQTALREKADIIDNRELFYR